MVDQLDILAKKSEDFLLDLKASDHRFHRTAVKGFKCWEIWEERGLEAIVSTLKVDYSQSFFKLLNVCERRGSFGGIEVCFYFVAW